MGASLNEIKAKIASTRKTSQITGAMQMVSAAKLQKMEKFAKSYQIYADKVHAITTDLVSHDHGPSKNPMMIKREVKRRGYLVITSDRGLVGGYNSNILKSIMAELREKDASEYSVLALGGMGADFFKSRGIELAYEQRGLEDQPSFEEVRQIVGHAVDLYQAEKFDELYVCYNHHVNSLVSQVHMEKMLPITIDNSAETPTESAFKSFELEPDRNTILDQLLPQYAESMIYGSIIDAKTAEHAAGMTAMKAATDNAKDVIDTLTIQYNRARQTAITQEITEIVAGASAL